jgi:plasmid maintenance system antidote protein VapI
LARAAGVPHITLSHIANGRREATADLARKVADALARWSRDTDQAAARIRRHLKTGG